MIDKNALSIAFIIPYLRQKYSATPYTQDVEVGVDCRLHHAHMSGSAVTALQLIHRDHIGTTSKQWRAIYAPSHGHEIRSISVCVVEHVVWVCVVASDLRE